MNVEDSFCPAGLFCDNKAHIHTLREAAVTGRLWLKLLLPIVLLMGLLASAALTLGAALPAPGQIAYISSQEGIYQIYLMDVERRISRRLLDSPVLNCCLAWSPDGQQISFMMRVGLNNEVFVLETHRQILRQITHQNGTRLTSLSWSPSGESALVLAADNGTQAVYQIDPRDGRATPIDGQAAYGYSPQWSPDGEKLLFVLGEKGRDVPVSVARGENTDIYVSNADGSATRAITHGPLIEMWPIWSPDGQQIAYVGFQNHQSQVYVMNTDSGQMRPLTSSTTVKSWPSWSPDGQRIAYLSQNGEKADIYAVDPLTGEESQLMDSDLLTWRMGWSPDGQNLIFEASRGNNFEIYLLDGDSKQPVQMTDSAFFNVWPVWRPHH